MTTSVCSLFVYCRVFCHQRVYTEVPFLMHEFDTFFSSFLKKKER